MKLIIISAIFGAICGLDIADNLIKNSSLMLLFTIGHIVAAQKGLD